MAANPQNLIPNEQRTPEQRRRNASKAGKASAAAKRKRKTVRECLNLILSRDIAGDDSKARALMTDMGISDGDMQYAMLVAASLVREAASGNVQAAKALLDATDNTAQQGVGNVVINIVDDLK